MERYLTEGNSNHQAQAVVLLTMKLLNLLKKIILMNGEFIDLAIMKRKYNLCSVVNHIGGKANCGHYKANALRLKQYDENEDSQNERDWFQFNDNTDSKLNNEVAMGDRAQRDAYMILYEFE